MIEAYSAELSDLVDQELATGRYRSKEEVLLEAMRLLRNRDTNLEQFRKALRARIDSLEQGTSIELEDDSLDAFLDAIEAEAADEKKESRN